MDQRIQCSVEDGPQVVVEINAFRILPEVGATFFLDFLHYSPALVRATVVARIRVHVDTLASIRERLSHEMLEVCPEISVWGLPSDIEVN